MNLGDVYLKTFFNISAVAILIAIAIPAALRIWKRIHPRWFVTVFVILSLFLVYVGNSLFHHDMFVARHLKQNKWVPQDGCTLYQPSFGHLFATFSMSRSEFDAWVASHPWGLQPYDGDLADHDSTRLGFRDADAAYATDTADNGNQLRVYFKDGTMFLSYNVM